jgi:hypothetical protein
METVCNNRLAMFKDMGRDGAKIMAAAGTVHSSGIPITRHIILHEQFFGFNPD